MIEWFTGLANQLQGMPVVQGVLAAFCTFILEDPTTIGSGLLVASGKMSFWAAFFGLSCGIAVGDVGLYGLGRLTGNRLRAWGKLDPERFRSAENWLDKNVVAAVLGARFLPGMRFPTYTAAGFLRVSAWKFALTSAVGSLGWTIILLTLTIKAGEAVMDKVGWLKLPLGLAVVASLAAIQIIAARYRSRSGKSLFKKKEDDPPIASFFEFWPPTLFYIPVVLYCLWLSIRHRGLMLFSITNPSIYSGGMIMESKSDILSMVPPEHQKWIARWTTVVKPEDCRKACSEAVDAMARAGLSFPVVIKPDVGQRSLGVRPVHHMEDLQDYMKDCSSGMKLIIQELVTYSSEAGVLYYRKPGRDRGRIISLTIKQFPTVAGDGKSTLKELILAHPRYRLSRKLFFRRHREQLDRVLTEGEEFRLVFAGSHCQGSVFRNGNDQLTPELLARIHEIASSIPEYYIGRFDIRCRSIDDLKKGGHFKIVEINGAGGEPTHIWDPETRLADAYKALFQQYRLLYEIGAMNRDRGHKPMSLFQLLRDLFAYREKAKNYPLTY